MDKVAVLIPCYNEEATIAKVISDCKMLLPPPVEIYVYDNNSTDKTYEIALKSGAKVIKEPNQGKGNVVQSMFRDIDAEVYIMVDGDDTYGLEAAPQMIDLILNQNVDMVVGDRLSSTYFTKNKRRFHNFGNSLVRHLVNNSFHGNVFDIMTGFRAFSYRFVKTISLESHEFEIETEMTIKALAFNYSVRNITIQYKDRIEGSISKLNTYIDGAKVLKTIRKYRRIYTPIKYFLLPEIISFIIFATFLTFSILGQFTIQFPVTINWIFYIGTSLFFILVIIFCIISLILHVKFNQYKEKIELHKQDVQQQFEEQKKNEKQSHPIC